MTGNTDRPRNHDKPQPYLFDEVSANELLGQALVAFRVMGGAPIAVMTPQRAREFATELLAAAKAAEELQTGRAAPLSPDDDSPTPPA